jgi:hypothetical protein
MWSKTNRSSTTSAFCVRVKFRVYVLQEKLSMPQKASPPTSQAEPHADQSESEHPATNAEERQLAPHRLESLTRYQERQVREIFDYLSPYLKRTFERFEFGFLRDRDPEREIRIWGQIIEAHRSYLMKNPDAAVDSGRDVFKCLMMISTRGAKPFTVPGWLWNSVNQFVIAS